MQFGVQRTPFIKNTTTSPFKSIGKAHIFEIKTNKFVLDATERVRTSTDYNIVFVQFTKEDVVSLEWTTHMIAFEFMTSQDNLIFINKTFEVKTIIIEELKAQYT